MQMFRSRAFASGNAAAFLMSASLFSAVFFMAQFQQVTLGQSPLDAGLRLLPWTATLFIVAPIAGSMIGRIGERPLIVTGLLAQAAGMAWIALIARAGLPYAQLIAPFVIAGAGVSMALPAAQSAVVSAVSPEQVGQGLRDVHDDAPARRRVRRGDRRRGVHRRRQLCLAGSVQRRGGGRSGCLRSAVIRGRAGRGARATQAPARSRLEQ